MVTLKRISTNLTSIINDVKTVGAKVVVGSVRIVTELRACWPFHQGMRAFAMQPVRLQAGPAYPLSSSDARSPRHERHNEWRAERYLAPPAMRLRGLRAFGAERGAAPIAAR